MTFLSSLFAHHLPEGLQSEGESVSASLLSSLDELQAKNLSIILDSSPELVLQLVRALVGSQYILDSCCRNPSLLFHWLLVDTPYAPLSAVRIVEMLELSCADCETVAELDKALRLLRQQLMVAIVWRDLNRLSDFSEVCESMTAMAEACIQQAVDFHYRELSIKHGVPLGVESKAAQPLLVLGMGKLGGSELNISSDIDLIFVFPESGETDHPSRPLDNQSFFTRLGQRLIKSLHEPTVDGFVFRGDMRLRPYGQSGALVSSFAALENYYATQGRDWERFAGIKARVVACSSLVGKKQADKSQSLTSQQLAAEQLQAILRPFIYRRYTDFSVIESLRKLKAMIVQEVRRKGMEANVKLGAGGIRELEFIAQSFQLVRGGRDRQLQERHWLRVMEQLDTVLDEGVVDTLREAYIFLRNTEHAIQAYQDQQTQQLPIDPKVQQILAWLMGFTTWPAFVESLEAYRADVSEQFQLVITEPKNKSVQQVIDDEWLSLWHSCAPDQDGGEESSAENSSEFVALLNEKGCQQSEAIIQQLCKLRNSWSIKQLSATAAESLDRLVPQLLSTAIRLEQPDNTLLRLLVWLEKIVGRSSYITLLLENPTVLRHLAVLFQGSVWIAELLAQMPSLLDELLDADSLYTLPTKTELQDELRQHLLRIETDDVESIMEALRYFKLAHSLRVAASDLAGSLPLMSVSDYLTWIAEVVLEEVLTLAWQQLTAKHGVPRGLNNDSEATPESLASTASGFVIVAYGKLGGIELSYSSDLDLVFIYKTDAQAMTDGYKPIDYQTFYTRLGQKIIHTLNTRALSGPLYEVDMRLRPSGNSGLLATSIQAFSRYQLNDAWTWEHQALVRARPIAGDADLMGEIKQLRCEVLVQERSAESLKGEVNDMRQKMREHLGSSSGGSSSAGSSHSGSASSGQAGKAKNSDKTALFHLKQDPGGIVDIEFMVQYAVLAWGHQQPDLTVYTDNIRILQCLQECSLVNIAVSAEQARLLIEIYKSYREVGHRLALQQQSSLIANDQFVAYQLPQKRQQVQQLWQQLLSLDDSC
jgi:glutamate-ammonia-ligase adenylyltransferase